MEARGMEWFSGIFLQLKDPRTGNARRHDLCELLVIALCSCLCGGTTCTEMAEFAEDKEPFLRDFLDLKNGLPSHDTFSRLFRLLDPVAFGECFSQFMQEFSQQTAGVVAIDGKTLRRSFDTASEKSALHMVSAWSCEERLVLAQIATDEKSNEITAVPQLLRLLNLEGRTVTVCCENSCMNWEKHSPKATGSRSRNRRLNVSCDGSPFFRSKKSRKKGSLSSANSAISVHVVPPQRHEHSAITNNSHRSCRRAFPVRGSLSCKNIPENHSIPLASIPNRGLPKNPSHPPLASDFSKCDSPGRNARTCSSPTPRSPMQRCSAS